MISLLIKFGRVKDVGSSFAVSLENLIEQATIGFSLKTVFGYHLSSV